MSNAVQSSRDFINWYTQRALAFRALRKIRAIVDQLQAEEESQRRSARKILIAGTIALVLISQFVITTPTALDVLDGEHGKSALVCE